jgi:putative sterol carrier protein
MTMEEMMIRTARDFFFRLSSGEWPFAPPGPRLTGSYRFDVDGAGSFHVRIVGGRVTAREARDDADCVMALSEEDLVAAATGRLNLVTAFLQGRIRIQGNLLLFESLHAYLRAVEQRRREGQAEVHP